jgi:hydrogenase maturation protein HypF
MAEKGSLGPLPELSAITAKVRRCHVVVDGVVQGVGFRPFVCRLARSLGLGGSVRNEPSGVLIDVQGDSKTVAQFLDQLRDDAPPAAQPRRIAISETTPRCESASFSIEASVRERPATLFPAPDLAVCGDCLGELRDPQDRRYAHPFLNCTACGPRFTIIRSLPYDRERTSMASFAMCVACRAEYGDTNDRRFHAEPTACPACGPRLSVLDGEGEQLSVTNPLQAVAAAVVAGKIVAIKGLGGYHLACDATNPLSVAELRRRKGREAKPLALMVKDVGMARQICRVSRAEAVLLESPARPIVLLEKHPSARAFDIAEEVAPRLRHLGLMLPYTALHHLLLDAVARPMVMTSGNATDEPIASEDDDARERLRGIADMFLVHDRPIESRCDDSIARVTCGAPVVLRRSRGYVPLAVPLAHEAPAPILACGGELKSVFALVRGGDAFLSQHLGDLSDERAYRAWTEAVAHFTRLLEISPTVVAHDLHPGYRSTAYAHSLAGLSRIPIQHHHAHIASCLADNRLDTRVIGVAWDGNGLGLDGRIWGGEFLVADLAGFERVGHFEEVPLPGGDAAIREPWRMAAVFLQAVYGDAMASLDLAFVRRLDRAAWRILNQAIASGLNAPLTSSAGRLFDAVASLVGLRDRVGFEAQGPMELEALAEIDADRTYPVGLEEANGELVVRTRDVIRGVVEDLLADEEPGRIATRFHVTLAELIAAVCLRIRDKTQLGVVALSGGVFQNVRLVEAAVARLDDAGFEVLTHHRVPPNDGGLALGQAAVAACLTAHQKSA